MDDDTQAAEPLAALLVIVSLLAASGFFSLFEYALNAARKPRLQKEALQQKKYRRVLDAVEHPRMYLAAARTWICVLRILAAFLAGSGFARYFEIAQNTFSVFTSVPLLAAACAAALAALALLAGDLLPEACARAAPERIAAALLPPVMVLSLPLRPFYALWRRIGTVLRTGFHLETPRPGITEDELRIALMEGEKSGIVESKERTMVEGVFYLGDRPVGAFMTHRSEIQWLDIQAPPRDIRAKALEYRSQRCFPVADGTLDAIIGAVYLEDIVLDHAEESPRGLRSIMHKAQFVPETMPALKAFESFKRGEADFLFVMDEYGGFAGILSVRDLVEEIVGDLAAPRHNEEPVVLQEDGSWLAGGSLNIDEAADLFALPGLAAAPAAYHTLAGFVLSLAGELPRTGESFVYQGCRFTVVDMDGNRIDKLLIKRDEADSPQER
jgi:putative hemolysin